MANSITPDAISTMLANPSTKDSPSIRDLVVQVTDLKPIGTSRYKCNVSDGNNKLQAAFTTAFSSEIQLGNLENLGLIRILDYVVNPNPKTGGHYIVVEKCEIVTPVLEAEIKFGTTATQEPGIVLKPKQEMVAKSAAQILREQNRNMAPSGRMGMTRRVYPLVALSPYQGNWTIKVRVTSKGNLRSYSNARGEGHVFNVELTDEDGTQIQATMFNEAARKFYDKFEMGKVYYISNGLLKLANKQYKTVSNDYEMTLNNNSIVEEVSEEEAFVPELKFNFVPIDQLGSYVNRRELVDVIGVVQSVSDTMQIKRKANNEMISKRDITIADESKKTVVVSMWNDLADNIGQELSDAAGSSPIVAIKSLKVGDFQGVSLSTLPKSTVVINPSLPESEKLKTWYNSEGKETSMESVGSSMKSSSNTGDKSVYSDRVWISHITGNPSLGGEKPEYFSLRAYISFIKPESAMWYPACKQCNKKLIGDTCQSCQTNDNECSLRYALSLKVSDVTGEAWITVFNDHAVQIFGCSADELNRMKEGDMESFLSKLKEATWTPHLFRVMVTQNEYNNEKRQRITVKTEAPVDFVAESKMLLEEISKMQAS